jgi:hypothetical protein
LTVVNDDRQYSDLLYLGKLSLFGKKNQNNSPNIIKHDGIKMMLIYLTVVTLNKKYGLHITGLN